MTEVECDLCFFLIKKYYGKLVANVGQFLCKNRLQSLGQIIQGTKLKPSLVRKALCVLIKHKVVSFKQSKKRMEYCLDKNGILLMLMIPKMIYTTKLLYGDAGELIIEEMLLHGTVEMYPTLDVVKIRLQDIQEKVDIVKIKKIFNDLIAARFIITEPRIDTNDVKKEKEDDSAQTKVGSKRKRMPSSDEEDCNPKKAKTVDAYCVNFGRFIQYFRDQYIISGVKEKFGILCGEIMRAILRISEVTTSAEAEYTHPISSNEVRQALPGHLNIPILHVEQYLNVMIDDPGNIIQKLEESSSNLYVVNLKKCIVAICEANVLSYVLERYGSKCSRIFRLLMLKNHLEQKQVEDFAMIPSKEAKELLYQLWSDHMLVMQEIPKTPDHAPSRTFYLFNVNINKVIRTLIGRSYRTLVNLLARQRYEIKMNERLAEKQARIEHIKKTVKDPDEDQLQEIDEMLTPAERDHLQKVEHCKNKLQNTIIHVANTAFIFNLYLTQ